MLNVDPGWAGVQVQCSSTASQIYFLPDSPPRHPIAHMWWCNMMGYLLWAQRMVYVPLLFLLWYQRKKSENKASLSVAYNTWLQRWWWIWWILYGYHPTMRYATSCYIVYSYTGARFSASCPIKYIDQKNLIQATHYESSEKWHLGLHSRSSKTSYRQISWSLQQSKLWDWML